MAFKKDITAPKKGMNRDKASYDMTNSEYTFALNANFHDEHGSGPVNLQNEPSNIYCSGFKPGYKVIGHKYDINSNQTYFFLTNPATGCSEIGYIESFNNLSGLEQVENQCNCNINVVIENPLEGTVQQAICQYNTVISDECEGECNGCLNFNINYPIHESNIQIKDEKTGKEIYFTDFRNPQRYIQLDNLSIYTQNVDTCTDEVVETCVQCDKMRIFKLYDKPCLKIKRQQNGGNLRAGMYEVLIAYSTAKGEELTDYYALTNPTSIHDKNNNILDQTNLDYLTNFAINVDVIDADRNYEYFKIAVVYRSGLDGSITIKENGVYQIDTKNVTISTLVDKKTIPLSDIISRRPYYTKARGLATGNGSLIQYGLESHREINLQPVVSLMGSLVKWATVQAYEDLYEDGADVSNYLSYMRDEVIPLSIKFHLDGGYETPNFVFIPRPPKASEIEVLGVGYASDANNESILEYNPQCDGNSRDKRWQYENTAEIQGDCLVPAGGPEVDIVVREVESSCFVEDGSGEILEVATVGPGVLYISGAAGIVNYINNNIDEILASTDTQWTDIITALEGVYAGTCEPVFGDNCSETYLSVTEEVVALGTTGEEYTEVSKPFDEYERVPTPLVDGCNAINTTPDIETDPIGPQEDTTFMTTYMRPGEVVYERTASGSNTVCGAAVEALQYLSGSVLENKFFLQYDGSLGPITPLQTAIPTTNTEAIQFTNMLHSNVIWYKVSFGGLEEQVVELSTNSCPNPTDDITNNRLRVTFYKDCPSLTEVPAYGNIIQDISLINDSDKFYVLDSADFGGPNSVAYIAIDSPILTDILFEYQLTGTSGDITIEIDAISYPATFNTDLTTTASDFVTAHATDLLNDQNIIVTSLVDVISFRMTKEQYNSIVITNVNPDLDVVETIIEEYNVLSPVCGCTNIFKRNIETTLGVFYTEITFAKKITYLTECEYSIPKLGSCDPIPSKYGLFSHWESTETYPCNNELFDSSGLIIGNEVIPEPFRTEFEEYYVDSISGGNYVLNSQTDFRDANIRHYKFPCSNVVPFMSTADQDPGAFGKSVIYPIGFSIDNEVINTFLDIAVTNNLITLEERLRINKYEIFRGDRSVDKSIIAKGLLFNMRSYPEINGETALYSNYPLNALGPDFQNGNFSEPLKNYYTFHSPDIHFYKPTLPRELKVEGYQFGKSASYFDVVRDHPTYVLLGQQAYSVATTLAVLEVSTEIAIDILDYVLQATAAGTYPGVVLSAVIAVLLAIAIVLGIFKVGELRYQWLETFRNLGHPHQFAYYQAAIGHYSYFIPNTISTETLRGLSTVQYLNEGRWSVPNEITDDSDNVNNLDREDSVFLNMGIFPINSPALYNNYDTSANSLSSRRGYTGVGRSGRLVGNAASPYVSLKQYLPSQYGSIYSINWDHTGFCGDLSTSNGCDPIFGGDTYISRFAVKRKFPFFTSNSHGMAPLTPFKYSDYFNVNPGQSVFKFYIDYLLDDDGNESFGGVVFPDNKSAVFLDNAPSQNGFYIRPPGKFYLFSYGFPYFLVESVVNCNNRYAKREMHENFYPNVGDIIEFTQESNVSIRMPNTYFYNFVYSSLKTKYPNRLLPIDYSELTYAGLADLKNTFIYSKVDNSENDLSNPWLLYKALDFVNFPLTFGLLIDMDNIESEQILARFENGFDVINTIDKLQDRMTPETKNLGTGGALLGRAVNFNKTDLGYAGTQNKVKVSCEFGHFWADAKRGKVFNVAPNAQGMTEITEGLEKWFKENLPFKILNYYPEVNVDNAYNGIGLTMGWDDRLKRVFITKKDFIPLTDELSYSQDVGFYTGDFEECAVGYEDLGDTCRRITTAQKIPDAIPLSVVDATSGSYGWGEPILFSDYNADGSGNVDGMSPTGYTFIELTEPFWTGNGVLLDRLVNRLGKWVTGGLTNTWYGASSLVDVTTTNTYYVALAADNQFRFSVDGVVILTSNNATMYPQLGELDITRTTFNKLLIYPITLEAGCHVIKIEGNNFGGVGMFAAAILDNTYAELVAATSDADLNYIYSTETETEFYETIDTYICPEGYTEVGPGICDECQLIEIYNKTQGIELVELTNTEYFEECSWTVAYSPLTKLWISYYSFKPNYYIGYNDYFQTGVNYAIDSSELGLWSHLSFLSSYQVFYGKLYPFTVESVIAPKMTDSVLHSIEYYAEVKKYYDKYNSADVNGVSFNKAWIYNGYQNSGQLNLVNHEKNNIRQSLDYPQHNVDSISILQTETNNKWSFNYFYNLIRNEKSGLPVWIYDCSQIDKEIDTRLLDFRNKYNDRLRGDYFNLRMQQDIESRYKIIYRFSIDKRDFYES